MSRDFGRADPLAIKVATALHALAQKCPKARAGIEELLISTPELRGLGLVQDSYKPIQDAPVNDPQRTLLLYCPEQGGWQTGVFFEGHWLDSTTFSVTLHPTHFTDVPPKPEGDRGFLPKGAT
jgi:hypothetical protein